MKNNSTDVQDEMKTFSYAVDRFADIQVIRYKVPGFEDLSLDQKKLVYFLSKAALEGRDILYDQNGKYNLRIRKMLEAVYTHFDGDRSDKEFIALEIYLKRVWFSNGIHHHYATDKFVPDFSPEFLRDALRKTDASELPLADGMSLDEFCDEVFPIIFDPNIMSKRVNQLDGADVIQSSACNYYSGVSQEEAESFYRRMKNPDDAHPVMVGLNSRLVKEDGVVKEKVWKVEGLYGTAIERIVYWLEKAKPYAETAEQREVIATLINYYQTGDLRTFDDYSILWVKDLDGHIDFTNGFIESYGDPLGLKGSWEAYVNFKDVVATHRTEVLSENAAWFEQHSPVDHRFKKAHVKGVSAKVITAAILGGDLYPSSAIGINLPNSNWIRSVHGSKSVTIGNLIDSYNKVAHGNGFYEEFVYSDDVLKLIEKYGDMTDDLHTDLHECLGHGSGQLLPGTDPDALKVYGSTIEEARADLFALYYLADKKLVDLQLLNDSEAYKAQYYTYILNGLMTQLVRISLGNNVEEAHMRNRQLIARWAFEHGKEEKVIEFVRMNGKTYLKINDFSRLRSLFGELLAEIQRIKSEGDLEGARYLVETYGVKIDPILHKEVLERYEQLHLAPYKGFVNPVYEPVMDANGEITDVHISYSEGYAEQMLRYSKEYANLPYVNN
ncbi:MAG: dihydrofolate reductase [Phocaeicola sp.]|nr:dihydrofolate reductase [Phocaeicola sp.]